MKRWGFARFAMVTALAFALAPLATPAPVFAQTQKPPIKIGFITTLTGGQAAAGKEMEEGFRLALDEVRGEVAGRKVQLMVEDDEFKPDVGLTKTRKLVERETRFTCWPASSAAGWPSPWGAILPGRRSRW